MQETFLLGTRDIVAVFLISLPSSPSISYILIIRLIYFPLFSINIRILEDIIVHYIVKTTALHKIG